MDADEALEKERVALGADLRDVEPLEHRDPERAKRRRELVDGDAEERARGDVGRLAHKATIAGVIAAAITGVFALKLLIKTSRGTKLKYFAFYCYALACIVLIFNLT